VGSRSPYRADALLSTQWRLAEKVLLPLSQGGRLMLRPSKLALILGLAGAMAGLPSLIAQQDEGRDEGGVAGAIRYEKAKQAAADRQARIEAAREHGARDRDSADRMAPEPRRKAKEARKDSADRANPRQASDSQQHPQ
jgi:hypothetical protein